MANVCNNHFYLVCEKNLTKYIDLFQNSAITWAEDMDIDTYDYNDSSDTSGGYIEGIFCSKWTFPEELKYLLEGAAEPEDAVYFRCLSEEYGCGYVAMNIFDSWRWRDEQSFDL